MCSWGSRCNLTCQPPFQTRDSAFRHGTKYPKYSILRACREPGLPFRAMMERSKGSVSSQLSCDEAVGSGA
jgi:hypothetical protein